MATTDIGIYGAEYQKVISGDKDGIEILAYKWTSVGTVEGGIDGNQYILYVKPNVKNV